MFVAAGAAQAVGAQPQEANGSPDRGVLITGGEHPQARCSHESLAFDVPALITQQLVACGGQRGDVGLLGAGGEGERDLRR